MSHRGERKIITRIDMFQQFMATRRGHFGLNSKNEKKAPVTPNELVAIKTYLTMNITFLVTKCKIWCNK